MLGYRKYLPPSTQLHPAYLSRYPQYRSQTASAQYHIAHIWTALLDLRLGLLHLFLDVRTVVTAASTRLSLKDGSEANFLVDLLHAFNVGLGRSLGAENDVLEEKARLEIQTRGQAMCWGYSPSPRV